MIHDLDLWGNENTDGTAKEHLDDAALGNAIVSFLVSGKGDYILNPSEGGILDETVFKVMNDATIEKLKFSIQNALYLNFSSLITVNKIVFNPDYQNRYTEIVIFYTSLLSDENNKTIIYINDTSEIKTNKYLEIEYTDVNLLSFVQVKKSDMIGKKLIYNINEACWIWGESFKFINLITSDPYFDDILANCNL